MWRSPSQKDAASASEPCNREHLPRRRNDAPTNRRFPVLTLIVTFIVVGLIVGALARLVVPGRNPIGIGMTILLGIVGAIVGGLIGHAIGAGWVITLLLEGAVAAALVYAISGSRGRRGVMGGRRRGTLV